MQGYDKLYKLLTSNNTTINPNIHPHNKNFLYVNGSCLFKLLNDSNFRESFKGYSNYNGKYKLQDIATAIDITHYIYNSHVQTKGTMQIIMPYICAMHDININKNTNLPIYTSETQKYEPKRFEPTILFWLSNMIQNDIILKNYADNELKFIYQYKITETNKCLANEKEFDACIPNIKLLFEVQENKLIHNNNDRDNEKHMLAIKNSFSICYIKEYEYKINKIKYLKDLWHDTIRELLIGGLFKYFTSNEFKKQYLYSCVIEDVTLYKQRNYDNDLLHSTNKILLTVDDTNINCTINIQKKLGQSILTDCDIGIIYTDNYNDIISFDELKEYLTGFADESEDEFDVTEIYNKIINTFCSMSIYDKNDNYIHGLKFDFPLS
jgi:hypothetical protein